MARKHSRRRGSGTELGVRRPISSRNFLATQVPYVRLLQQRIAELELIDGRVRSNHQLPFSDLADWDAAARRQLKCELRETARIFARACLLYEPLLAAGIGRLLQAGDGDGPNVVEIRSVKTAVLRGRALVDTFYRDQLLGPVATLLERHAVRTFEDLIDAPREALRSIGVTPTQIEQLDRACMTGGLRMRAA